MMRATSIDEVGHSFNNVKVLALKKLKRNPGQKGFKKFVEAKCHCGNVFEVRLDQLKGGKAKSCGCNRKRSLDVIRERQLLKTYGPNDVDPKYLPAAIYPWGLGQSTPNAYAALVKIKGEMTLLVVPYGNGRTQRQALSQLVQWRNTIVPKTES